MACVVVWISFVVFFFKQKTAYEMLRSLVGSEMCIRDRANYMYIEAFNNYRMGFGGAIAVVLFTISIVFVGLSLIHI